MTLLATVMAVALAVGAPEITAGASSRKFHALVFMDRSSPDTFVQVDDLRVNDTITNESGDRFFVLETSEGTFQLPFDSVAEVEFTRFLGMTLLDTASYEARVVLPLQGVRRGTMKLRALRGEVKKNPWHQLLMMRRPQAERLYRILFLQHEGW